jgi:M6 family metalloprotease-like protein
MGLAIKVSSIALTGILLALTIAGPSASAAPERLRLGLEECKLPSGPRDFTNFGFPRSANRLPSEGVIKAQIIFVDFPDAVGTDERKLRKVANRYTKNFKKFYSAQSYGKVSFDFTFLPKYFRIDQETTSYKMNLRKGQNGDGTGRYFQDALRVSDREIDFTGIDVVYVIPSNTNREITYGPAFPMGMGSTFLQTDEGAIQNGTVAGTDSRLRENSLEWVWMAHETGHLFGLEHPWKVNSDAQGRGLSAPSHPVWDLMLNMGNGETGDFLGWSRFLIGWLEDSNVFCIDADNLTREPISLKLSPLSSRADHEKFIFVKTGTYTGIAIEVRTRGGLNSFPASWQGPLVYSIDTRKIGNEGAASLVGTGSPRFNGLSIGTLKPGQQVVSEGIKVRFKSQAGKGYNIEVSK